MAQFMIDRSVFDGLKETVGEDFVPELVNAFLEEAPTLIAQLRQVLQDGEAETFRRAAHSIKSNAATFGAMQLFEQARELESLGRENRLVETGNRIDVLEETFGRSAGILKELCA